MEKDIEAPFLLRLAKFLNYCVVFILLIDMVFRFTYFGQTTDPFFYIYTFYMPFIGFMIMVAEA